MFIMVFTGNLLNFGTKVARH